MPNIRHPRRGSLQYWPRKRAKHSPARIRSWASSGQAKPLGFIAYKAGMTQVLANDHRPKAMTKGEVIALPATILDCPPNVVIGVCFYQFSKKVACVLMDHLPAELAAKLPLPKKKGKIFEDIQNYDDLRLLVQSQPSKAGVAKRPKVLEIGLGGSTADKAAYAKNMLGKELPLQDMVEGHISLDVHAITKGKGFQGTVKRYGVPIRQHKAEKTKRGIGTLGSWTPKRVEYTVAQPGKMGYHLRTEYNKQILKVGTQGSEVTPKGGLHQYGLVRNSYLLLKGSIPGSRSRAVVLTQAGRPNKAYGKDAFTVISIST